MTQKTLDVVTVLVCTAVVLLGVWLGGCGSTGDKQGNVCNFPTLVETTPDGGDQLFLCGDGDVLECRGGSCAFGNGSSGSLPTTNTTDSNNPTGSNNRTTINNPPPTPTPRFG